VLGSGVYYVKATHAPDVQALGEIKDVRATVTGTGVVAPAQNPDLAFVSGGRVTHVYVEVGDTVGKGQTLATLDVSTLAASREQAAANAAAAEAKLADMKAGARDVDVEAKKTLVAQSETNLQNTYTTATTHMQQAYGKSFSGVSQYTDALFNQPNTVNPTVVFTSSNGQAASELSATRVDIQNMFPVWQSEVNQLSIASTSADVEDALTKAVSHLQTVRQYNDKVSVALSTVIPSATFNQAASTAAQVSAATYRDVIYAAIAQLQADQQQIANQKIAIQAAKDSLNQVTAGATKEQIAAQEAAVRAAYASVQSFDSQIRNNTIVAPFSGVVASVRIKIGDIAGSNTPAIALNARGAQQVIASFSEIDITKVHVGDAAQVTLDAYGNDRIFPATIVSVDAAPSTVGGATGYRATVQFDKNDTAIATGMTANITIQTK
jgi:HlyD family secretion protein